MTPGRARGGGRPLRILVTVTFNANQLRSHLLPIVELPDVASVTLVADTQPPALPKLRAVVPHRLAQRVLGRAGSKLLVCLWLAATRRPDWIVGFNFVPHGLNARVVGGMTRTKSLYHMIGGQREWVGGGWSSENGVLGRLPRPVPLVERLLLWLIGGCTAVATMGERGRAVLVEHGVDPARVRVIPPAIDTDRFRARKDRAPSFDVITVSRLTENKRTKDVLEAVARLRASGRPVRLAVVGDGPLERELHELARTLELGDAVTFFGFRESLEELYADARVFVLASKSEALAITVLEAMASGLPCVVSRVGELPDMVRDGETGFTFESGDVDALAAQLERLLGDDELCARLGAAAVRSAESHVSVPAVAARYAELFGLAPARGDREAAGLADRVRDAAPAEGAQP